MKKIIVYLLSAFVLLAVLATTACSPKKATLDVVTSDIKFDQSSWEVPAGVEVTLNLKNEGALEHEFVIMKLGTKATAPFSEDDEGNIFWEIEAEAGETVTAIFTAPTEPGEYEIVCGTAGHIESGMVGTLIVK